jgi:hypothetical protein
MSSRTTGGTCAPRLNTTAPTEQYHPVGVRGGGDLSSLARQEASPVLCRRSPAFESHAEVVRFCLAGMCGWGNCSVLYLSLISHYQIRNGWTPSAVSTVCSIYVFVVTSVLWNWNNSGVWEVFCSVIIMFPVVLNYDIGSNAHFG